MIILSTVQETIIGIVAAVLAMALVAFTIIYNVKRHKSGKSCCGGDCAHCKACSKSTDRNSPTAPKSH